MRKKAESVNTIIFNEAKTKVLLVKRRDVPVWVLPGGGIDSQESPEDAALRELLEETGYQGEILRKVGEYFPISRLAKTTYLYECVLKEGSPLPNAEVSKIQFFSIEALPTKIPPPYEEWIQDALHEFPYILQKKIYSVNYWNLFLHFLKHPLLVFRFLLARLGTPINS